MLAKRNLKRYGLPVALAACAVGCDLAPLSAQTEPSMERLRMEIARLAEEAHGVVGVGVIHLESGRSVYLNKDERFPMASTVKVPMAVQLLHRVDRGEVRLDSLVHLESWETHPGGTLTRLFNDPGVALSLTNLIELTLLISDNSATDQVLKAGGGPAEVTGRMRALGIDGIRVDRSIYGLILNYYGVANPPHPRDVAVGSFRALWDGLPEEKQTVAAREFDQDPQDTATPDAMADLLARLWRGEILSGKNTDFLLDVMYRCETGTGRIKGLLPSGTQVAHKTGTIGGTTNDVGIIDLPFGAGHVVTAIFVKESTIPVSERERVIAQISRAVYDYFLFNSPRT